MDTIKTIELIKTTPNSDIYSPRKLCFAENINRNIDQKRVNELTWSLKSGWRNECPILVYPAELVKDTPNGEDIVMVDIVTGYKISPEELKDYFLALDGQHRLKSQLKLNSVLPSPINTIPSSLATLLPGESIMEYLVIINNHKDWTKRDKIRSAAGVDTTHPLLKLYNEYVAESKEPDKFPVSVLNLIAYGNEHAIKTKDWDKIMKKEKSVPSGYNLKKAQRLINLLQEKFKGCNYTSKYLPQAFHRIQNETGREEDAFSVFEAITNRDVANMNVVSSKKFKMTEESINRVIDEVKLRVLGNQE